jgi:hypothetical protein
MVYADRQYNEYNLLDSYILLIGIMLNSAVYFGFEMISYLDANLIVIKQYQDN